MKKITVFGIIVLLLSCFIFSCDPENKNTEEEEVVEPDWDDSKEGLDRMSFVDNLADPGKKFVIYEDLSFKVDFIKRDSNLPVVEPGTTVTGQASETSNKWTDDVITGEVIEMSSSDEGLSDALGQLIDIKIELIYIINNNEITGIITYIPEHDELGPIPNMVMGGIFIREEHQMIIEYMTFVDDTDNPTKEFSINNKLEFSIKYLEPAEELTEIGIEENDDITGNIRSISNKWIIDFTGNIQDMKTEENEDLSNFLKDNKIMNIKLEYTKESENIKEVKVSFPYDGDDEDYQETVDTFELLIGGTYKRKTP